MAFKSDCSDSCIVASQNYNVLYLYSGGSSDTGVNNTTQLWSLDQYLRISFVFGIAANNSTNNPYLSGENTWRIRGGMLGLQIIATSQDVADLNVYLTVYYCVA